MPFPRIAWTDDMDAALREGAASDPPVGLRMLEEQIGVSRDAIRRRKAELGIAPAPKRGRPKGTIEWHDRHRATA